MIRKAIFLILITFTIGILIKCGVTRKTYEIELLNMIPSGIFCNNEKVTEREFSANDTLGYLFRFEIKETLVKEEKFKNFDVIPEANAAYDPAVIRVSFMKDSIQSLKFMALQLDDNGSEIWTDVTSNFKANRFSERFGLMNDEIFYETSSDKSITAFVENLILNGYPSSYYVAFVLNENSLMKESEELKVVLHMDSGKKFETILKILL